MTDTTKQTIETSKLKPASENILYVLATIAGELEKPTDFETTKKNARLPWLSRSHRKFWL